jgi:predicted alpha/beta-hydrolase family hydrolase
VSTRRLRIRLDDGGAVSGELRLPAGHRPGTTAGLILAHGAGGDMHGPLVECLWREVGAQLPALRFNFPYREAGRRAPDRAARLENAYRQALRAFEGSPAEPRPVIAGGKSMGGRIATHLAAAGEQLGGLVLLGYPLHPAGRPDRLRDAHLPAVRCPLLFIQGSRDRLCDLDLLAPVLRRLEAPYHLHVIEEGDHSFRVPKRTGRGEAEIFAEIRDVVMSWVGEVAGTGEGRA